MALLFIAEMFVPLHDRHQVKQYDNTGEHKPQCDIAFATRPVGIIIPHPSAKDRAGSPISFSRIRVANSAVM